jgi:diadenosine tetraphosphate (Ap4A) HIT family hydrolase
MPEKAQSPRRRTDAGSPLPYHRSDCFIFRRQDGQGHEESRPLGGYIVEGKHFLAERAPLKSSHVGTVIVEARRHLLDFGEMTSEESVELGGILKRLVPAVKFATGAERVYVLALMERAPHFHLWLVPKKSGARLRGLAYLAKRPTPPSSRAAEATSKKIRARYERSRVAPNTRQRGRPGGYFLHVEGIGPQGPGPDASRPATELSVEFRPHAARLNNW